MHHDRVLIVDFGSQVTQLIARRVREAGVYCEIHPFMKAAEAFERLTPRAVIFSGGPASVPEAGSPRAPQAIFDAGVPILAICYGQQTLCEQLGGRVESGHAAEFGRADVEIVEANALFDGVWEKGGRYPVWMSHGDRVTRLPEGFRVYAVSENAPFAVAADEKRRYYTTMFHPEVVHTPDGARLIANFLHKVAGLEGDWTMAAFREEEIRRIRAQVGKSRVICGLSGGVDFGGGGGADPRGDRRPADLRLRRPRPDAAGRGGRGGGPVPRAFQHPARPCRRGGRIHRRARGGRRPGGQAQDHRPPVHRRIRGRGAPDRQRRQGAGRIPGPGHALPGRDRERVVHRRTLGHDQEPPQRRRPARPDADEARRAACASSSRTRCGHSAANSASRRQFVGRHPFPGPGLAIRCPGGITREKLEILRKADAIYLDEIRKAGLYDTIWQAFAVLLPVRTVGVMGDGRTYDSVVALRAVTSVDGMTADFYPYDMAFLGRTATRIINEVKGVNRVVYDVTSKPPGTIEWE